MVPAISDHQDRSSRVGKQIPHGVVERGAPDLPRLHLNPKDVVDAELKKFPKRTDAHGEHGCEKESHARLQGLSAKSISKEQT